MATNTTAEEQMMGWVSPGPQRNTWDIIYSCLSVFLLCSWRAVHLNLPTPEESEGEWNRFQLGGLVMLYWPKRPLRAKWRRKIVWMILICLAPEIGVGIAATQYLRARTARDKANAEAETKGLSERFTMAHAFFANMGGIAVRQVPLQDLQIRGDEAEGAKTTSPLGIGDSRWTDTVSTLLSLVDFGLVSSLSDADIRDKSHSDVVTKIFAILQSSWLVVNSVARAVRGLSISQLELARMAFIICALAMYGFWWHKPFNVERRHVVVKLIRGDGTDVSVLPRAASHEPELPREGYSREPFRDLDGRVPDVKLNDDFWNMLRPDFKVPLFPLTAESLLQLLPMVAFYATGALFSAVHLLAWNWAFPSPLSQFLWRYSAITALTTSPGTLYTTAVVTAGRTLGRILRIGLPDVLSIFTVAITFLILVAYVASRVILLFLTFYCFVSMPASTYRRIEWAAFIPHFGA